MSRNSIVLLPDSSGKISITGDKVKGDGFFGFSDGSHTVSFHVHLFTGRIWIEASLAADPTDDDWFPVWLTVGTPFVPFEDETSTTSYLFEGNFVWVRARLDRDYIDPQPDTIEEIAALGSVKRILMNH